MADDPNQVFIMLNRAKLQKILSAYRVAKKNNQPSFTVEGAELLTSYARYFLLHWCRVFNVEFKDD